jgi:hypothetical protein
MSFRTFFVSVSDFPRDADESTLNIFSARSSRRMPYSVPFAVISRTDSAPCVAFEFQEMKDSNAHFLSMDDFFANISIGWNIAAHSVSN